MKKTISALLLATVATAGNTDAFRLRHSVNQTIPSGPYSPVIFDTEERDDNDLHDVAISLSKITIQNKRYDGWYSLEAGVCYMSNLAGDRSLRLVKNTTVNLAEQVTNASVVVGALTCLTVSTEVELVEGDFVEVWTRQSSGGPLDILVTGGAQLPAFWGHQVGK